MTTTGITQRDIAALAALVHSLRPEWDEPGIAAAIRRCPPLPLDQVAIAFIRAAKNAANDTPAAVALLNNRAWDDDWYPPCKIHSEQRARRTNGECASCFADRTADDSGIPARRPTPPPEPLRQLVAAHTKREQAEQDTEQRNAQREAMEQARAELDALREKATADG